MKLLSVPAPSSGCRSASAGKFLAQDRTPLEGRQLLLEPASAAWRDERAEICRCVPSQAQRERHLALARRNEARVLTSAKTPLVRSSRERLAPGYRATQGYGRRNEASCRVNSKACAEFLSLEQHEGDLSSEGGFRRAITLLVSRSLCRRPHVVGSSHVVNVRRLNPRLPPFAG